MKVMVAALAVALRDRKSRRWISRFYSADSVWSAALSCPTHLSLANVAVRVLVLLFVLRIFDTGNTAVLQLLSSQSLAASNLLFQLRQRRTMQQRHN